MGAYPRRSAVSSRLNYFYIAPVNIAVALLKETIIIRKGRLARLATCRCDASAQR